MSAAAELSEVRRLAARAGLASRWGEPRGKSHQVRVDEAAWRALMAVPERDRRAVASRGVYAAATGCIASTPCTPESEELKPESESE